MTHINKYFLVNLKHAALLDSQTNDSYKQVLFRESKHTERQVLFDSQTNDSYKQIIFNESKHTEQVLFDWITRNNYSYI